MLASVVVVVKVIRHSQFTQKSRRTCVGATLACRLVCTQIHTNNK
jgi:hypothetical protein